MNDTKPATAGDLSDAGLRRIYPSLRRFAGAVAPREIDPDDLMQEAIERLLVHGTNDVVHIEAYVRQIIVHTASNHRRQLGRLRRALARLSLLTPVADAEMDYPSDLAFLDHISPRARAVLFLQEVEGLQVRAIAHQLGMSEAAVKQTASRARHELRDHIEQETSR
jgi:RNA polymerase sigma factor (sigma-70 family)